MYLNISYGKERNKTRIVKHIPLNGGCACLLDNGFVEVLGNYAQYENIARYHGIHGQCCGYRQSVVSGYAYLCQMNQGTYGYTAD